MYFVHRMHNSVLHINFNTLPKRSSTLPLQPSDMHETSTKSFEQWKLPQLSTINDDIDPVMAGYVF